VSRKPWFHLYWVSEDGMGQKYSRKSMDGTDLVEAEFSAAPELNDNGKQRIWRVVNKRQRSRSQFFASNDIRF
jgi:hypothetical protein